jgi:hypothetical protein
MSEGGAIFGGIIGLVIAWILAVSGSKFTYLGGILGIFEGMGVLQNLLLYLILGGIGAIIGSVIF